MLDAADPTDRRCQLVLHSLGLTADDIGEHGLESLRTRLDLEDGADLAARLAAPAPVEDPITTAAVAALERQHGGA